MVQKALTTNSLVCLPTGLGKTLIAAVVMFNYYRWFPHGKVVFLVRSFGETLPGLSVALQTAPIV